MHGPVSDWSPVTARHLRALAWLNLAYPAVLLALAAAVAGGHVFQPARMSDPLVFSHWSGVFVQFASAVAPVAALVAAHLFAYRAARSGREVDRRRARAWCLGVIVLVVLFGLQAAALGAFDGLDAAAIGACLGGLAALVAVCVLDVVGFWRPGTAGELAPTPGFEPGTR